MLEQNIDALIIAATDREALIEPLRRAHEAGIPIISVDTFIGDGDYENGTVTFPLSYIGSDNVEGGRIACEALIEAIGGAGSIYIQSVKPGISTTEQREQGCIEAIEANDAVSLVGINYNEGDSDVAAEQTAALLAESVSIDGIFGANLFSARGAARAVNEAGLRGVVKVSSFDAPEEAIADLRNELVDMVIAQLPSQMGQIAMEYAIQALNGDVSNIEARVPTFYVVITRDNVDSPQAEAAIYSTAD